MNGGHIQQGAALQADSNERLRSLADHLPDGFIYQIVEVDEGIGRRFAYISKGVEAILGVSQESVLADPTQVYGLIEPEFQPELARMEAHAIATGEPFRAEVAVRGPGGRRWLQLSSARRTRFDGLKVWDGIALDVTQRRQAEEERAHSERRLAIATGAAAIGIWEWDLATNAFIYSERAKAICGFPPNEPVTYEQVAAVTHPDDFPWTSAAAKRAVDPAIRSNEIFRYRIIRADTGEVRWVLAHGEATFGERSGAPVALSYTGTLMDITEQARAEEALTESEARLRLAVDAGEMAVWELDPATQALTHSPQLNRLYGLPEDARPTADDLRAFYAPGERERIEAEGAAARARGDTQIQLEYAIVKADGTEAWMLLRAALAPGSSGKGPRVIGVIMDITDRRLAEERVKLVARELQHRVKNSLAIVQTIANQSFRGKTDLTAAAEAFSGRLGALAAATDIITANDWADAYLADVVEQITRPFRGADTDAFLIEGPNLHIPSQTAVAVGMALYELTTNAAKYGSLSVPQGRVRLSWAAADAGGVELHWREEGGPPVIPPTRKGFGTRLLERGLFAGKGGSAELLFERDGLICRMRTGG